MPSNKDGERLKRRRDDAGSSPSAFLELILGLLKWKQTNLDQWFSFNCSSFFPVSLCKIPRTVSS